MDIKDLNKPQLILLTVLLSFVTSIATGITTVSLMQEAPASVTVPINRVIQQTVEKVQQVEGKTTVQTVVIKEEDLLVDAIEKNKSALFTISKEVIDAQNNIVEIPTGRGFAISTSGIVVVDGVLAPDTEVYYVKNDSGKFKAEFVASDANAMFSLIKIGAPLDPKSKLEYTPANLGDFSKMKVGQKIIVLGSSLNTLTYDGSKDLKLSVTKSNAGSVVINLDGDVVGVALFSEVTSFAPVEAIKSLMASS